MFGLSISSMIILILMIKNKKLNFLKVWSKIMKQNNVFSYLEFLDFYLFFFFKLNGGRLLRDGLF